VLAGEKPGALVIKGEKLWSKDGGVLAYFSEQQQSFGKLQKDVIKFLFCL
jgi:hypothetical protein